MNSRALSKARTASQAGDTPPPDDPMRRHQQEAEFDERAMADKRLEAIKQIRKLPKSAKPPTVKKEVGHGQ